MTGTVTNVKVTTKKGRAHFPEPSVTKIEPPPGVVPDAPAKLTYDQIKTIVDSAVERGFGRGAIVAVPGYNMISADVWNWGIVTDLNYATPAPGKTFAGPLGVKFPMKHGETASRTTHHYPDELFLVYPAPSKEVITEKSKEMREQFAVGRRK